MGPFEVESDAIARREAGGRNREPGPPMPKTDSRRRSSPSRLALAPPGTCCRNRRCHRQADGRADRPDAARPASGWSASATRRKLSRRCSTSSSRATCRRSSWRRGGGSRPTPWPAAALRGRPAGRSPRSPRSTKFESQVETPESAAWTDDRGTALVSDCWSPLPSELFTKQRHARARRRRG